MIDSDILAKLNNKRIGVLYGGLSSEREISIKSGTAVLNALKKLKLNVCGIDVNRDVAEKIKKEKIDIAYIALHGQMGEDGTIQGMLEILGIPYTGCGVFSSAASMDKDISKRIFRCAGILTPEWKTLKKFEAVPEIKKYPVVVKPVSQGSTIGVVIVEKVSQFVDALNEVFKYGDEILIEQFIKGKEITVGVLNGKALPVIEIVPKGKFYDFKSKYQKGGSQHIIPAGISEKSYKTAQDVSEKVYKIFKCRAICRVDMIVSEDDRVWVLENNTIPGMTETSLVPDEGRTVGYSFETLVLKILESAL
ncbi:D-alanine--D-alanine ligase [Candidatus Endomicrobiellum agilis]|jgi:D-alanine-D-alanine ligase|uniref:D-alanine--D-alanine ligase n=1 Tax=Candidatus Endomicrobiellum agilis TaxID=3238957 RepID=UPI00284D9C14|nr:D-alanine--D-alanine ligase [Endomicrobium sp.]MDR3092676.1 D-alanine--D-alanine ligase [Endomicrobium sp.]